MAKRRSHCPGVSNGWPTQLLVRPSGTEPVRRVYAEAQAEADVAALLDYGQEVAASAWLSALSLMAGASPT